MKTKSSRAPGGRPVRRASREVVVARLRRIKAALGVCQQACRLVEIRRPASMDWSTKRTNAAPRLRASTPMAPVPANRSRQVLFVVRGPRILNSASRTRSQVGRMISTPALGAANRRPRALPPVMRTDEWSRACVSRLQRSLFLLGSLEFFSSHPPVEGDRRAGQDIEKEGGEERLGRVAGQQDDQKDQAYD